MKAGISPDLDEDEEYEPDAIEQTALDLALDEGILARSNEPADLNSIEHARYRDQLQDCINLYGRKGSLRSLHERPHCAFATVFVASRRWHI